MSPLERDCYLLTRVLDYGQYNKRDGQQEHQGILEDIQKSSSFRLHIKLDMSGMRMSTDDFHRILGAAPFERWETLTLGRLREDFHIPEDANLDNLTHIKIGIVSYMHYTESVYWATLLSRIAVTSLKLQTIEANEQGLSAFMWTGGNHIDPIMNRVTTVKFEGLLASESIPHTLPLNVSRLHLDYLPKPYWDITQVTHLEIERLRLGAAFFADRPSPNEDPCFPNVEYLYVGRIRTDINTGWIRFPKLRTLKYNVRLLDPLAFFIALMLETIIFPKAMMGVPPPMGKLHSNPPKMEDWMRPTTIRFEGGIRVDHLLTALSWFPKVKHLTATISSTLPPKVVQETTWTYMEEAFLEELEDEPGFKHATDLTTAQFNLSKEWDEQTDAFKKWDEFVGLMAQARKGTPLKQVGFWMKGSSRKTKLAV
jgi:hypothetical protein